MDYDTTATSLIYHSISILLGVDDKNESGEGGHSGEEMEGIICSLWPFSLFLHFFLLHFSSFFYWTGSAGTVLCQPSSSLNTSPHQIFGSRRHSFLARTHE